MKKFFEEVKRLVTDKDGNFGLSYELRSIHDRHRIRGLVAAVYARALTSVTYDEHGIELCLADLEDDALLLYDRYMDYMDSSLTPKHAAKIRKVRDLCEEALLGSNGK